MKNQSEFLTSSSASENKSRFTEKSENTGQDGKSSRTVTKNSNSNSNIIKKPSSKRIISSRVFSGCVTCRSRHLKCDEQKPGCLRCQKAKLKCAGYDFSTRVFVFNPKSSSSMKNPNLNPIPNSVFNPSFYNLKQSEKSFCSVKELPGSCEKSLSATQYSENLKSFNEKQINIKNQIENKNINENIKRNETENENENEDKNENENENENEDKNENMNENQNEDKNENRNENNVYSEDKNMKKSLNSNLINNTVVFQEENVSKFQPKVSSSSTKSSYSNIIFVNETDLHLKRKGKRSLKKKDIFLPFSSSNLSCNKKNDNFVNHCYSDSLNCLKESGKISSQHSDSNNKSQFSNYQNMNQMEIKNMTDRSNMNSMVYPNYGSLIIPLPISLKNKQEYFISHFANNVASILLAIESPFNKNFYRDSIVPLSFISNSSRLLSIIEAIGALHISQTNSSYSMDTKKEKSQQYLRSIEISKSVYDSLISTLNEKDHFPSIDDFTVIMLLCFYDIMSSDFPNNWVHYLKGAKTIFHKVFNTKLLSDKSQRDHARFLISLYAYFDIQGAMATGNGPMITGCYWDVDGTGWTYNLGFCNPLEPHDLLKLRMLFSKLMHIMSNVSAFAKTWRDLMEAMPFSMTYADRANIVGTEIINDKISEITLELISWRASLPSIFDELFSHNNYTASSSYSSNCNQKEIFGYAGAVLCYWCACVIYFFRIMYPSYEYPFANDCSLNWKMHFPLFTMQPSQLYCNTLTEFLSHSPFKDNNDFSLGIPFHNFNSFDKDYNDRNNLTYSRNFPPYDEGIFTIANPLLPLSICECVDIIFFIFRSYTNHTSNDVSYLWSIFIAATEAANPTSQNEFKNWFEFMKRIGQHNIVIALDILENIWESMNLNNNYPHQDWKWQQKNRKITLLLH